MLSLALQLTSPCRSLFFCNAKASHFYYTSLTSKIKNTAERLCRPCPRCKKRSPSWFDALGFAFDVLFQTSFIGFDQAVALGQALKFHGMPSQAISNSMSARAALSLAESSRGVVKKTCGSARVGAPAPSASQSPIPLSNFRRLDTRR